MIHLSKVDTQPSMAAKPSWFHRISHLSDDPTHPGQIALRVYALSLALSLGPSLIPFAAASLSGRKSPCTGISALEYVLRRELSYDGFAFAITLSVGGGAVLHHLWNNLDARGSDPLGFSILSSILEEKDREIDTSESGVRSVLSKAWKSMICTMKDKLEGVELHPEQRTFLANAIASSVGIMLLQKGRERASRLKKGHPSSTSPTLDLTLLLVVRALDSIVQSSIHGCTKNKVHRSYLTVEPTAVKDFLGQEHQSWRRASSDKLSMKIDALLFWACSARFVESKFEHLRTSD